MQIVSMALRSPNLKQYNQIWEENLWYVDIDFVANSSHAQKQSVAKKAKEFSISPQNSTNKQGSMLDK